MLLKNLSERVNKLNQYLYTAKIYSSEFGFLRAKKVKRIFIFTNLKKKSLIYTTSESLLLTYRKIHCMKVEMKRFLFVKWPPCRSAMWLCGCGLLILSHHPPRFGVHRPCKNGIYNVFYFSRDHVVDVSRHFLGGVPGVPSF